MARHAYAAAALAAIAVASSLSGALANDAGTSTGDSGADYVTFGDAASESAHAVTTSASSIATDARPPWGTHAPTPYRTLGKGAVINVTFTCPPGNVGAPLYLTLKMSGDERDNSTSLVTVLAGAFGGQVSADAYPPELTMCLSGRTNTGHACVEPVATGRPLYSTFLIPKALAQPCSASDAAVLAAAQGVTASKVRLSIETWAGAQKGTGLYRAYLMRDPLVVPLDDEGVGATPPIAPPRTRPARDPTFSSGQWQYLQAQVGEGLAQMAGLQAFGTSWWAMVANGSAPAVMTGAIINGGVPTSTSGWSKDDWKNHVAGRSSGSNNNWFRGLEAMAHEYRWSSRRRLARGVSAPRAADAAGDEDADAELLHRIANGLDYYRRAQGANGGYVAHPGTPAWVGGPVRSNGTGCLEGYGHMGLGAAFGLVGTQLSAAGLLDVRVDDDDDPSTPNVTRWAAYSDLFDMSRDFLMSNRGHAPNQDVADQLAAVLANDALRLLTSLNASAAPPRDLPDSAMLKVVYQALGLANSTIYPQAVWFSPQGVSMEPNGDLNGGFTAGYSDIAWMAEWLAELTGDDKVAAQAGKIVKGLSYFRTVDSCFDDVVNGPYECLRLESFVSARHAVHPSRVSYGPGIGYGALHRKDATAVRLAQLRIAHGDVYGLEVATREQAGSPHFPDSLVAAVKWRESYEALAALPPTATRLPAEPGQPDFAWADATAGMVVVQHTVSNASTGASARAGTRVPSAVAAAAAVPRRLYAALQWRHGFNSSAPAHRDIAHVNLNNATRLHFSTDGVERVATVHQQLLSPGCGFRAINAFDYGGYAVAMNMAPAMAPAMDDAVESESVLEYTLSPAFVGAPAVDLVTGTSYPHGLPAALALMPQQAVVLYAASLDPLR